MLKALASLGLLPLTVLAAERSFSMIPLREQVAHGVDTTLRAVPGFPPLLGNEQLSSPAVLHARQAVCGPGKLSCNGGCIPDSSTCCPGSGYCDTNQYCTVRGTCCPNGKTCLPATVCGVGMVLCNAACMPEGAVCCPGGGYCAAGGTCLANSRCSPVPVNGAVSAIGSIAVSPTTSPIAATSAIPTTSADMAMTTPPSASPSWTSGAGDPDVGFSVPSTTVAPIGSLSSPAVSMSVPTPVVPSQSTMSPSYATAGARRLPLENAVANALFVVGVVHAVVPLLY